MYVLVHVVSLPNFCYCYNSTHDDTLLRSDVDVLQLLSQHQHGVDVAYQPNWPRQFGHQYAHSPIYFQDQMPYVNANWQMTAAAGHAPPPPPDTQHYGYFAPGFSQPFYQAESNAMMYPTHQPLSGVQGYHHHPSWSSLVSSTGSIGSVGSSGHSSSMRRRSTKRQVKKKHHNMANSVETRYDGETLFSMQSKLCFGTLVVPSRIFRHYVTKPWSWRQVELSVSQRIRKVLGSYSSASNVLIKMRSNWCLMKPSLRSKVRYSGAPSTIVFRPTSQHRCSIPHL